MSQAAAASLVDLTHETPGPMHVLLVEDDPSLGRGLPVAIRRLAAQEGVRLGLPIAKRIAEVHGASLRLANAPSGRGLRVEIRFPRDA